MQFLATPSIWMSNKKKKKDYVLKRIRYRMEISMLFYCFVTFISKAFFFLPRHQLVGDRIRFSPQRFIDFSALQSEFKSNCIVNTKWSMYIHTTRPRSIKFFYRRITKQTTKKIQCKLKKRKRFTTSTFFFSRNHWNLTPSYRMSDIKIIN